MIYTRRPRGSSLILRLSPYADLKAAMLRPEIVAHRDRHRLEPLRSLPGLHDRASSHSIRVYIPTNLFTPQTAAFRALVEENVKSNVQKIANSAVIKNVVYMGFPYHVR